MDNIERAIEEKKYSIKEVSAITGIKEATIRKWEKDFDLNISRDDNNRRYYTDSDIERLKPTVKKVYTVVFHNDVINSPSLKIYL